MIKNKRHSLYLSVCKNNIRRYYLMPCKSRADVHRYLFEHKGALIDANVVYSDDVETWRSEMFRERVDLDLSERLIDVELANCKEHPLKDIDRVDSVHEYLGRCAYQYMSVDTTHNSFIEIISMVRAQSTADAYEQLHHSGSILMEMNYFDADFGYAGKTFFLGVKFVHRILNRLPSYACLCEEECCDQDWKGEILDDDSLNELFEDIVRVDDNRHRAGLPSLGSISI